MTENICLPKNYLIIIFIVFIGLTIWYINISQHLNQNKYDDKLLKKIINSISNIANTNTTNTTNKEEIIKNNIISSLYNKEKELINKKEMLSIRDKNILYDDFIAPERRDYMTLNTINMKKLINIPTQGYPDNYQLLGVLLRDNTESAFNLFGRQTYPGSNQYEYYVEGNANNNKAYKIPIKIRGDKEIMDKQRIRIPGTDESKGEFTTKLYNYETPRYIPY